MTCKVYVWTQGDPSVGIDGEQATVEVALPYIPVDGRAAFRKGLVDAFSHIFEGRVICAFDWELENNEEDHDGTTHD